LDALGVRERKRKSYQKGINGEGVGLVRGLRPLSVLTFRRKKN